MLLKQLASKTDTLVNIAILATCVFVAMLTAQRVHSATPAHATPGFKSGDAAEDLPGVVYTEAASTVVLYIKSTCQYCTQSMPFFARLRDRAKSANGVRLVAVSPEDGTTVSQYLQQNGLQVDAVVPKFVGKALGTPTIVIVGRDGKIRNAWMGRPPTSEEQRILDAAVISN